MVETSESVRIVAFAGHARSVDVGDADALDIVIAATLGEVRRAFEPAPILLVGAAEGADRIAIDAWHLLGGQVAIVHPFLPEAAVDTAASGDTWLDGASGEANGTHPHLDQTRFLMTYADLLVASWTGARARGPGGTADAVALAVSSDIPVVWIQPGADDPVRIIPADRAADQTELAELAAGFGTPLPSADAATIATMMAEPTNLLGSTSSGRLDRLLDATVWRSYALFRRALGGRPIHSSAASPPPADLASQHGFAVLDAKFAAAEAHASGQAAIHRSEQLLLIVLAVLAAAVGASPLPKLLAIIVEFVLAILAFATWWVAERAHRHERWGRARQDAEALRIARASWAIGIRPWKGIRGIARVLPPRGALPSSQRLAWIRWGLNELIVDQRAYHRRQGTIDRRISHRLEQLENTSFLLLLLTMAGVIVATAIHRGINALPTWVADITIMVGALVPVVGAASMALEAKFGFSEHAVRSRRLIERLNEIDAAISPDSTQNQLLPLARKAIAALREESTVWADGINRRALFRGG